MSRTGPLGPASVDDVASICQFLSARNTFYPIARDHGFEQHECNLASINETILSLVLPMCWVAARQLAATTRIDVPTALAAARQVIATIPGAELNLTVGKWVVSRYDLLSVLKQMRRVYPDLMESTLQGLGLPLGSICEHLLINRFTQICEDMVEAGKVEPSPEKVRTRTVYGIAGFVLQGVSPRFDGRAIAETGSREYYDYISFLPAVATTFNAACDAMINLDRGIITTRDGGHIM